MELARALREGGTGLPMYDIVPVKILDAFHQLSE